MTVTPSLSPDHALPSPVSVSSLCVQLQSPAKAILNGDVRIEGDQLKFLTFVQKFERGA